EAGNSGSEDAFIYRDAQSHLSTPARARSPGVGRGHVGRKLAKQAGCRVTRSEDGVATTVASRNWRRDPSRGVALQQSRVVTVVHVPRREGPHCSVFSTFCRPPLLAAELSDAGGSTDVKFLFSQTDTKVPTLTRCVFRLSFTRECTLFKYEQNNQKPVDAAS